MKTKDLNTKELQEINGGGWFIVVIEIIGGLAAGFSLGYGYGSYDCDCPENDGRRFDEMGPTHNIA